MNRLMRALRGTSAALCVALAMLAAPAGAGAEEVVVHYVKESLPQFEEQLHKGQVSAVTFNKRVRSMRVTLKNGQHVLVVYPPKESAAYIAKVEGAHAHVTILAATQAKQEAKKPVHHKLRYIAGGVLLVVIIIVGVVLLVNRKRERD